jgi:hypothetical protein
MTAVNNTFSEIATTSYAVENSSGMKYFAKFGKALTDLFILTVGDSEQAGLVLSFFGTVDSTIAWFTDLPDAANEVTDVYQSGDKAGRVKLLDKSEWKIASKISFVVAKAFEFGIYTASYFDLSVISNAIGNGYTFVLTTFDLKGFDFTILTQSAPVTFITNIGLMNIKNVFNVFSFTCNIVEYVGQLEEEKKGLTEQEAKKELHVKAQACAGLVMEISKIAIIGIITFASALQGTAIYVGINVTLSSVGIVRYMCGEKGPLNESFNNFVDWVVLV